MLFGIDGACSFDDWCSVSVSVPSLDETEDGGLTRGSAASSCAASRVALEVELADEATVVVFEWAEDTRWDCSLDCVA